MLLFSTASSAGIFRGEIMNVFNALCVLVAFLGLFSFLCAVKEKKSRAARIYHKFDPLRKLDPRYPKAFGLPIFIVGLAIPFPLTSFFVDAFFGAVAFIFLYGYFHLKESIVESEESESKK